MATIELTKQAIRAVKHELQPVLPNVRSTHLTEAIAAALGFSTNAALLALLSTTSIPPRRALEDAPFRLRLAQLGYTVPDGFTLAGVLDEPTWTDLEWTHRTLEQLRDNARRHFEMGGDGEPNLGSTPMEACAKYGMQLKRDSNGKYWAFHTMGGAFGPCDSEYAVARRVCDELKL